MAGLRLDLLRMSEVGATLATTCAANCPEVVSGLGDVARCCRTGKVLLFRQGNEILQVPDNHALAKPTHREEFLVPRMLPVGEAGQ